VNIYVGNLSFDASEEDLRQLFSAYGQVTTSSIIKDRYSGESRGFGFVEMASKDEAQAAINALNGKDFKGRALRVNEARPREDRPRGGGGGAGGGGGFRGGGRGERRGGGGGGGSRW